MKTEIGLKFLQFLNLKKQDKGFTLVELLVVIIIIGILSAIALPSLLSQTTKARQSEARTTVGVMNRAQQAYYFEKLEFTEDIPSLGVGISNTDYYSYSMVAIGSIANGIANKAQALNAGLKGYTGGVFKNTADGTTTGILCETLTTSLNDPGIPDSATNCGIGLDKMH